MKQTKFLFVLAFLCLQTWQSAFAETFEVNGIVYNTTSSTTVEVGKKTGGYNGDIVIPSEVSYNGNVYSVTSFYSHFLYSPMNGGGAFSNCTKMTSIVIPNSITSIGNGVFVNCTGLTSITIPNSVKIIGEGAFSSCI